MAITTDTFGQTIESAAQAGLAAMLTGTKANAQGAAQALGDVLAKLQPSIQNVAAAALSGQSGAQVDLSFLQAEIEVATEDVSLTFIAQEEQTAQGVIMAIITTALKAAIGIAIAAA